MKKKLTWHQILKKEKSQEYFLKIFSFIQNEKKLGKIIYPNKKNIFNAFRLTPLEKIKIVIVGQDPYHGFEQAHGLAFSVLPNATIPPSLKNIFKEISTDINKKFFPKNGCLISWATQGILLLNTILTVEHGKPYSHANIGWETFTNKVIMLINAHCTNIIFFLWGMYAQKKIIFINQKKHFVLKTSHPSPRSAYNGFFGCKHFSKANFYLKNIGRNPIDWIIDSS